MAYFDMPPDLTQVKMGVAPHTPAAGSRGYFVQQQVPVHTTVLNDADPTLLLCSTRLILLGSRSPQPFGPGGSHT